MMPGKRLHGIQTEHTSTPVTQSIVPTGTRHHSKFKKYNLEQKIHVQCPSDRTVSLMTYYVLHTCAGAWDRLSIRLLPDSIDERAAVEISLFKPVWGVFCSLISRRLIYSVVSAKQPSSYVALSNRLADSIQPFVKKCKFGA